MCSDHSIAATDLKTYLCCFNVGIHLPDYITLNSMVLSYGALITQSKAMANRGDFIKTTNAEVY